MVRQLEQWEIDQRTKAQERDIHRRIEFIALNTPTKTAIIDILTKAETILHKDEGSVAKAQQYILQTIDQQRECDEESVDWFYVDFYIKQGCFSDSDMGGLLLVPRRIWAELTVFSSLMDLNPNTDEHDKYEDMF